jgi:hypothetical protein
VNWEVQATPDLLHSLGVDEVRFPTPFVRPRSLLSRTPVTIPCHRPSSTCTQVHVPRAPTSPKNKRSLANNAFRAPVSPANRSDTILAWAGTVYPGSHAPMTPASVIPLPRSPSFVSSRLLRVFRCPSLTCIGFQRSVGSAGGAILSVSFLHLVDILRTPVHSIPATLFPLTPRLTFLLSVMPQSSSPLPPPFPISALLSNGFLRPNPDGSLAIAKIYPSLRRLHRKVPF